MFPYELFPCAAIFGDETKMKKERTRRNEMRENKKRESEKKEA